MSHSKNSVDSKVSLLVIPGEKYHQGIIKFIKGRKIKSFCYVTINKGYGALVEDLKKNKIDPGKSHFIDCVTRTIIEPKKEKNCLFVSSPRSLTEISLAISKVIPFQKIILIDSLSTLLIYNSSGSLREFVHSLANKTRMAGDLYLVLVISDQEKKSDLFNQLEPLVDQVIRL